MIAQLLALGLTALAVGIGLGAMSMVKMRPRKTFRIDPKRVLDEIEEMTAG